METLQKSVIKRKVNSDFEVSSLDSETPSAAQSYSWMYYARFVLIGMFFGVILVKSEVVSWFRIQEMFRFQSFRMYGIIGSAVVVGMISVLLIKKFKLKSIDGEVIQLPRKMFSQGQVYGGLMFGLGWAITGACPGPLFAQISAGATVVIITLMSAIGGTWVYGLVRQRLPH